MASLQKRMVSEIEDFFSSSDNSNRFFHYRLRYGFSNWMAERCLYLILSLSSTLLFLSGCAATTNQQRSGSVEGGGKPASVLPWQTGNLKLGYIRSDVINRDYPEYRDADNELQNQNRKWLQESNKLEQLIQRKEREHEELSLILSEAKRLEIESEIKAKRKELQKFQNDTWYADNSSYVQRRREVMEPIDARVNDAIWKVAEEKDLDMVFDTIAGNIVYVKPALDITEDVLEQLTR